MAMEKWAIINDWHLPKHDKRKVALWLKIMREWKPDHITILGDFDDFEAPGRWVKGTPTEFTERVAITTETVSTKALKEIREDHPDANIDWLDGNHEFRLEDYIAKSAPALVGAVTIERIFDLANLGIEYQSYKEPPKKKFGGYYVHHGTLLGQNAGDSVRKECSHYGVSMIMGHTHRLGNHRKSYYDGRIERGWEAGHMTNVKLMDYMPHQNWQHGFLTGYIEGDKCFIQESEFQGNTVYMDGRKFVA